MSTLSRLNRIARIDPRFQTAEQGFDSFVSVVQHEERRTGARVFVRSGAIGDDPLLFIEVDACDVDLEFIQRDGQRADNVTLCKRLSVSHVYNGRGAGEIGCVRFLYAHTRDIIFGGGQV